MANPKILILLLLLVLNPFYSGAQNKKKQLIEKKKKIEKEIKQTNSQLEKTKQDKQANLNQLILLNRNIGKREELISTINTEVTSLDSEINTLSDTISRLSRELLSLRKEYARMIYSANKNRNAYSRLMFLFSSKSFNQAYQRLKYFQQYSAYRQTQVKLMEGAQVMLANKKREIERVRNSKLTLVQKQETEKKKLTEEKNQKNTAIRKLSSKEKELLKYLHEHEQAAERLQSTIEAIIAEEVRKAEEARKAEETRKAKEAGKKKSITKSPATPPIKTTGKLSVEKSETAKPATLELTPKQAILSQNFSDNKGRLPWPVERGSISSSFGEHAHPQYKNIKIKNNGIDINTSKGATARAVFDGVVSSVITIPGLHNIVIMRHGAYLSVYSNLANVYVKKGDEVNTRQTIGTVFTDPANSKTMIHFELWQGTALMNPESWIAR
ncbi:MAG: murein hydrolase activator EnvC family protein [Bacteroidales bacterium]